MVSGGICDSEEADEETEGLRGPGVVRWGVDPALWPKFTPPRTFGKMTSVGECAESTLPISTGSLTSLPASSKSPAAAA